MHLLHVLCAGFRETIEKTNKGKKTAKGTRGKEEKFKIKYEFHRVECSSKITSNWDKVTKTNLGHVSIDEFKQQVLVSPKIEEAWRVKRSIISKVPVFPPALISPELIFACRECYHLQTRKIITVDGRVLDDLTLMSIR